MEERPMSQVVEVNSSNFESEVLQAETPVLVDFAAEWCGPCKQLTPILKDVASQLGDQAKICHLDIDQSQDIALKYDIMSVPTLLFLKGGTVQDKSVGVLSKQAILDKISNLG
jgi:thioredoxin 1